MLHSAFALLFVRKGRKVICADRRGFRCDGGAAAVFLTVSFCAFAAVLCILLGSNRYMADCVQQEAQAKDELASLIALGQQLADASDLLTNEVRAYAETEDITHLNNYWTEVLATRQRDAVIQTLENDQLPDEEAALLAQAKRCSDLLIDTETRSMYLILAAAGQNADDFPDEPLHRYVTRVTETPLSGADTARSAAQKARNRPSNPVRCGV